MIMKAHVSEITQVSANAYKAKPFFNKNIDSNFFSRSEGVEKPFFSSSFIQPKLTIGQPNDKFEREADSVADSVMQTPDNTVQRICAECEDEKNIQSKPMESAGGNGSAASSFTSQLNNFNGGGSPLPASTNQFMSKAIGSDFSSVRVHTNTNAIEMNQGLNARAFTHGSDIYFNEGEYSPSSTKGKRLLAHELTHVVQQTKDDSSGPPKDTLQCGPGALAIGGAALAGFILGFGAAWGIDYATMTRDRALRFAQSMGTGWLSRLPNCPCTKPGNTDPNWAQDSNPNLSDYHPGAVYSYRSTAAATPGSRHGQQCTYDASEQLIKTGPGAGTPDYYAPGTWYNIPYHVVYDVKTWQELGSATYNQYWIPNQGVNCGTNAG
jgi:hypothetical protein